MTHAPGTDRTDVSAAYDRWAGTYDADRNTTRDLDAMVVRRAPLGIDDREVLELGSGTGKNTEYLAARARTVIAMDVSEAMVARAHQRISSANVRFLLHDVRDPWPIPPASLDAVVANLILEHVHDLAPVFYEAARVLRAGGQFFLCELHPYRQLTGSQAQFTDPATGQTVKVAAHVHTVSEYVNGAIEAGFHVRELGEWIEDGAVPEAPPRLLSLLLDRG